MTLRKFELILLFLIVFITSLYPIWVIGMRLQALSAIFISVFYALNALSFLFIPNPMKSVPVWGTMVLLLSMASMLDQSDLGGWLVLGILVSIPRIFSRIVFVKILNEFTLKAKTDPTQEENNITRKEDS